MYVVTHSGKFHADDVLAWSLLCHYHPKKEHLQLIRTRETELINQADIVFNHTNLKGILYLQDYKI